MKKIDIKKINFKNLKVDNKIIKIVIPIVALVLVVSICIFIGIALSLSIQNIEIEEGENLVHLMANIFNNGETFSDRMVDIVFLDQEEKEIGRVPTFISQIEHGGAIRIDTVIDKKSAKAHNFRVEG